nr:transcription factor LHW-like [Tanacetum cinerariifolium]
MSINCLLDRTIKHMIFMQNAAKQADKIKQAEERKHNRIDSNDTSTNGVTWAGEIGNQTMMICEEQRFFLEIVDIIRRFGLIILKGVMETHGDKLWARFIVEPEVNKHITRYEIFAALVEFLQTNACIVDDKCTQHGNSLLGDLHQDGIQNFVNLADMQYLVKEHQEKDKIRSKPDKNGKRGEAGKSQKQLQSIKARKTEENAKRRGMERGFLSQKGSEEGNGVKEKQQGDGGAHGSGMGGVSSSGDALSTQFDENMNGINANISIDGGFKSSGNGGAQSPKANVTATPTVSPTVVMPLLMVFSWGRRWHTLLLLAMLGILGHPDENLLKEDVSIILVWVKLHGVPITAFSVDRLSAIATKLVTPLMLDSYTSDMCIQSYGRSSYAQVMIEPRADVELKDNIVVAMPNITREGHYTCNVCVEYEWKRPTCSSCKVFRHIHEECPKNIGACEKKTMKKPSQTSRGVSVGPKIELLTSGQAILTDKAGNPLKKVEILDEYDSEYEVASIDNDMARSMASKRDLSQKVQAICDNMDI